MERVISAWAVVVLASAALSAPAAADPSNTAQFPAQDFSGKRTAVFVREMDQPIIREDFPTVILSPAGVDGAIAWHRECQVIPRLDHIIWGPREDPRRPRDGTFRAAANTRMTVSGAIIVRSTYENVGPSAATVSYLQTEVSFSDGPVEAIVCDVAEKGPFGQRQREATLREVEEVVGLRFE